MPQDRADDSYAIYSSLLPLGETEGWPAKFYAVGDTTIETVEPGDSCVGPPPGSRGPDGVNAHSGITPPANMKQEFQDLLADYDTHCHERITLTSAPWKTRLPITLLNENEQNEFQKFRNPQDPRGENIAARPRSISSARSTSTRTTPWRWSTPPIGAAASAVKVSGLS